MKYEILRIESFYNRSTQSLSPPSRSRREAGDQARAGLLRTHPTLTPYLPSGKYTYSSDGTSQPLQVDEPMIEVSGR